MEGFTLEPVVPDESERVEDVKKARTMAAAESPLKDYAAQYDRAKDKPIDDTGRLKIVEISNSRPGLRTNISLRNDGSIVEYAGQAYQGFDKNMSDEEVRDAISKRSEDAKKRAENAGDLAGKKFDEDKEVNK